MALYHDPEDAVSGTCDLTSPWEEGGRGKYKGQPTVVFSGASTVGQMSEPRTTQLARIPVPDELNAAIQLLKLSGFDPIITTASLKNADFLKTIGATHVLDRLLSPGVLYAEIRKITPGPLKTIYDAVGVADTQNVGYDLLAPGGTLATVRHVTIPKDRQVPEKVAF